MGRENGVFERVSTYLSEKRSVPDAVTQQKLMKEMGEVTLLYLEDFVESEGV